MRIFRHYTELPAAVRGGVVALGNFDGVHLGHQRVIGTALQLARQMGIPAGVTSFEPHPRTLFSKISEPFRLTPFRIKSRLIEALAVDYLLMQHFDREFASHSPEDFVDIVLMSGLGVRHVVVGYDYVFGKGRGGNVETLQAMARERGFGVTCVDKATTSTGELYSSTGIREALVSGRPALAARLLGRPWEIEGRVEHGAALGRTIGFPTANIDSADYLRPAAGVYAIRAGVDHGTHTQWLPGVANFGRCPTVDKKHMLLEAHLFDFDGDLYGRHLRVQLIDFLRPEQKFAGLEALRHQIAADCQTARAVLATLPPEPELTP